MFQQSGRIVQIWQLANHHLQIEYYGRIIRRRYASGAALVGKRGEIDNTGITNDAARG